MIKIGIIRCQQTEDMCPGTMDFIVASEGKMAFAETGPVKVVGFVSCGGCPGKRAVSRANLMVERGADEGEHSQKNWAWHKDHRVDTLSSFSGSDGHKSSLAVALFKGLCCTYISGALEYGLTGGDMLKIEAFQPAHNLIH